MQIVNFEVQSSQFLNKNKPSAGGGSARVFGAFPDTIEQYPVTILFKQPVADCCSKLRLLAP